MRKYLFIIVLVSSLLFLTACGESSVSIEPVVGEGERSESQPSTPEEGVVEIPSDESDDQAQTESENETENTAENDQFVMTEEAPDACVDCHIDQASLTDTAKPEEDLESESEGEG